MILSMRDLTVVATSDASVTLNVSGVTNPVVLEILKYERGAVVTIPWVWTNRFGFPGYEALKAVLRPLFGHVETRTGTDPRFAQAARARGEGRKAAA